MTTDRSVAGALASQVKPTFMLPAVGMSLFGGLLAPTVALRPAAVHALAVAAALYVAHLVDEYVDAHVRGEEPPRVGVTSVAGATLVSSAVCLVAVAWLWWRGHRVAAALTLPLWVLAVLHAPLLDRRPIPVTVDYPLGIGLVVVGAYAAQSSPSPTVVGTAATFVVVLTGVKVTVDRLDVDFDRTIDKRTLPVVLGERRAARASAALGVVAGGLVGGLVTVGPYPTSSLLSLPLLGLVALAGLDRSARRAVRRQMLLVYPLTVVLFVSQCLATRCVVVRWVETGVGP